jgi:signal transduction histidine kinase
VLPPALPARGEARALSRVVLNLLANAVLHNRPQGRIAVSATDAAAGLDGSRDGDGDAAEVELRIADTGPGMTAAQLRQAFRPYQRGAAARRGVPGSGLGLPSCEMLMRALGGALTITSAPGVGTTVSLRLPRA